MADKEKRWPRAQALKVAEELLVMFAPYVERAMIAGSIRRNKPDVGDIEIVVIPKFKGRYNLFDEEIGQQDALEAFIVSSLIPSGAMDYRLSKSGNISFGKLNKLLIHNESQIPVDVFTATAENFGRDLLVRTGNAEFNIAVMARFKELWMHGHAYGPAAYTDRFGKPVTCPTEIDMFNALQWAYVEPERRTGATATVAPGGAL